MEVGLGVWLDFRLRAEPTDESPVFGEVRRVKLAMQSTLDLGHGVTMPRLGLGTYKSQEGDEVSEVVEAALRRDTAASTRPRSTATRRASAKACVAAACRAMRSS